MEQGNAVTADGGMMQGISNFSLGLNGQVTLVVCHGSRQLRNRWEVQYCAVTLCYLKRRKLTGRPWWAFWEAKWSSPELTVTIIGGPPEPEAKFLSIKTITLEGGGVVDLMVFNSRIHLEVDADGMLHLTSQVDANNLFPARLAHSPALLEPTEGKQAA